MKRLFILGIIILLLLPSITTAGKKHNTKDMISNILNEINVEYQEEEINISETIIFQHLSIEKLDEIGDNIKTSLEIDGEKLILEEDNLNHLTIYGYDKNENFVTIILSSFLNIDNNQGETSLFINIIKREKNFNINGIIERIENIFKSFEKTPEINIIMTGTLDGKLDNKDINKIIGKIINKSKGKIVETYKDPFVESYTIYSNLIEEYIFSMEKKINLNLVIRYNEDEDKTYIILGTPIITTGY